MNKDLKIGSVPFINVRPLIYGIENQVEYHPPSKLSALMKAGYFHVSIIPIVEYLKTNLYEITPSLGIVSNGPVQSVVLFYRGRLEDLKVVTLDKNSLTSNELLRLLFTENFKIFPQYQLPPKPPTHNTIDELAPGEGVLLIGDNALIFPRGKDGIQSLDLGGAWTNWTKTPFVFAAWMVRKDLPPFTKKFIETLLTECLEKSKIHFEGLVNEIFLEKEKKIPRALIHQYLSSCVYHSIGPKEQRGIELFGKYLSNLYNCSGTSFRPSVCGRRNLCGDHVT
jgi:predicted solute-binding protein